LARPLVAFDAALNQKTGIPRAKRFKSAKINNRIYWRQAIFSNTVFNTSEFGF
jgi:hypothetical protein